MLQRASPKKEEREREKQHVSSSNDEDIPKFVTTIKKDDHHNKEEEEDDEATVLTRSTISGTMIPDDSILTTSNDGDDNHHRIALLSEMCPESTLAERIRALRARKNNIQAASELLIKYLEWRRKYSCYFDDGNNSRTTTSTTLSNLHGIGKYSVWNQACRAAASTCTLSNASPAAVPNLPWIVTMLDGTIHTTHDGHRILQHLPARIDLNLADAETYATALALYLDRCGITRDSLEKICVVIDVRGGPGWANIPATQLLPFIKLTTKLLNDLHPERLAQCILVPLPAFAKLLWNVVKTGLDPATARKIQIVAGSAGMHSPIPSIGMEQYMTRETIQQMERNRSSTCSQ
jgi:hypothetical protein